MFLSLLMGVSVVASILLGCYSLQFRKKDKATKYFAVLCFVIAAWSIVTGASLMYPSVGIFRLSIALIALIVATLFVFTCYFVTKTIRKSAIVIALVFLVSAVIFAFSPLVFTGLIIHSNDAYPLIGVGMFFFVPYVLCFLLCSFFLLIRVIWLQPERTMIRVQVEWITAGLVGTVSMMIFFGFIAPYIWHTGRFIPVAMLSTVMFIGCTAYAMTRYRFLDVRVLIKKSLLYALFLSILATAYAVVVLQIYYQLQNIAQVDPIVWLVGVMLIFVILFEVMHKRIQTFLEGIFFLEVMDFTNVIHEHQHVVNPSHDLSSYVLQLAGQVQLAAHSTVEQIFLLQRHYKRFKSFYPVGSKKYILLSDDISLLFLDKKFRGIHLVSDVMNHGAHPRLRRFFRKYNVNAYMTVEDANHELIAVVLIGRHKNNFTLERVHLDALPVLQQDAGQRIAHLLELQKVLESSKVTYMQHSL